MKKILNQFESNLELSSRTGIFEFEMGSTIVGEKISTRALPTFGNLLLLQRMPPQPRSTLVIIG
jgi:hypothetical protein